jgi:hypothetical protein
MERINQINRNCLSKIKPLFDSGTIFHFYFNSKQNEQLVDLPKFKGKKPDLFDLTDSTPQ